jgi:hypothetical protein
MQPFVKLYVFIISLDRDHCRIGCTNEKETLQAQLYFLATFLLVIVAVIYQMKLLHFVLMHYEQERSGENNLQQLSHLHLDSLLDVNAKKRNCNLNKLVVIMTIYNLCS